MYYKAVELYQPGDVIQAGHWGQMVLGMGGEGNTGKHFYKEYLLEKIRLASYPTLPSRLKCLFLFSHKEQAMGWRDRIPGRHEHTYAVNLVDPNCVKYEVDMYWIEEMDLCRSFTCAEEIAHSYWKSDRRTLGSGSLPETLALGIAVIVERVSPLLEDRLAGG